MSCSYTPHFGDARVTWYKNNQFISANKDLYFTRLNKNDLGLYKCYVRVTFCNDVVSQEEDEYQLKDKSLDIGKILNYYFDFSDFVLVC